jgi:hypothetical protein
MISFSDSVEHEGLILCAVVLASKNKSLAFNLFFYLRNYLFLFAA